MDYVPHNEKDRRAMLKALGVPDTDALFNDLAPAIRLQKPLPLPKGLTEMEARRLLERLAAQNKTYPPARLFVGAGAYAHYTPAAVWRLALRSEFYTSYTPYQPEASQGMLQAIYEWQTMVCQLTGMEVANASMYDGASALAEAVLLAARATRRRTVLLAASAHFHYKAVACALARHAGLRVREIPWRQDGALDLDALEDALSPDTAGVFLQNPNAFGVVEDVAAAAEKARARGAWLGASVAEATSLGVLKPPGEAGAEVVTGDAQALGLPLAYGGPYAGFFALRQRNVRLLPGRLVGETTDARGKRGYIMTLQTREQHIRRAKATSNICTNQALCALAATIHLALLGRQGLRELAARNAQNAHAACQRLLEVPGVEPVFEAPFYNEFALRVPHAARVHRALLRHGFFAGLPLEPRYPSLKNALLFNVTEQHEKEDVEALAQALEEAVRA